MLFKINVSIIAIYLLSLLNFNFFNRDSSAPAPPPPPDDEYDLSAAILSPSPTAAEFAKYGDIPVDLSSGVPSISIPMYTLQGRGLSVPISLSYHASGVRIDDVSSMVGMSWSLNSGGVITRTVRDNPDELPDGYMSTGDMIPYPFEYPEHLNWLNFYANGNLDRDGQPDLFSFNVGGASGKFFFEGDGTIRIIPHQNLKIEYEIHEGNSSNGLIQGAISEIKITTGDGLIYTFGGEFATERSKTRSITAGSSSGTGCESKTFEELVPTSWYLSKIYNPNTNDQIDFTYQPHFVNYYVGYNETHNFPTFDGPLSGCTGYSFLKCITKKEDKGVHITEINSSFGKVTFDYNNTPRVDLQVGGKGVQLQDIKVFGATGTLMRRFHLEQDFWYAQTGTTPSGSDSDKYRMFLESVTEYAADGTTAKPPHKFFYNNGNSLPPRLSYDQDHWGFYNGASNTNLTPYPEGETGNEYVGADRSIDPEKTQFGLINKIIYPTGGETEFEYFGSYQIPEEVEETEYNFIPNNARQFCPNDPGSECVDGIEYYEKFFILTDTVEANIFRKIIINSEIPQQAEVNEVKLFIEDNNGDWDEINLSSITMVPAEEPIEGVDCDKGVDNGTYTLLPGSYKTTAEAAAFHLNEAVINVGYHHPTGNMITIYTDFGGLRIKKITSDSKINGDPLIVKKYDYEVKDWVLESITPIYLRTNEIVTNVNDPFPCSYAKCKNHVATSSSVNRMNKNGGGNIFYEKVTEILGENGEFGKTVSTFSFEPDLDPEMGRTSHFPLSGTPGIDNSWKCGYLLHQTEYDKNGSVVKEVHNDYSFQDPVHNYSAKAIVVRKQYEIPCPVNPQVTCDSDITDAEFQCRQLPCWNAFENLLNVYVQNPSKFTDVFLTYYDVHGNIPSQLVTVLNLVTPLGCPIDNQIYDAITNYEVEGDNLSIADLIDLGTDDGCYWMKTSTCFGYPAGTVLTMPGGLDGWAIEYYDVITSWVKLNSTSTTVDGVTSTTNYEYGNNTHLNVTATETTNSDGLVHRTENKYAIEMDDQSMIDKFMHNVPLETRSFVDGDLIGGKLTVYDDFPTGEDDENGDPIEMTLPSTVTQILHDDTPLLRATVLDYDNNGNMLSFTKEPAVEYDPISIVWTNDLPTKKVFIGWQWNWLYDDNTRLMKKETNIDGIESTYNYDGFQRLISATARNGALVNSYSYHLTFALDTLTPNHIISTSSETGITTYQYMDGLGRGLQAVNVAYSPDKIDVVNSAVRYDAFNRPIAQYLPYLGVINGTYIPPAGDNDIVDYEDSPLSRETARVFAGGGTISQTYSTNGKDEVKLFNEDGTSTGYYDNGTLSKHNVTDENGNMISTYTDITGRTVLVRRYLHTLEVDTYNVYDKRGNLVYVIPPGAGDGNNDLSYQYEYDDRNRLESKRIPGANPQTFTYNEKDELVTSTDGNGIILTNTYNDYGQLVSTSTGGDNLIYNTYSSAGSSKGKITNTQVMLLDGTNNVQLNSGFTYDDVGRVETTTAQNHLGGNDIITNFYDGGSDRIRRVNRNHNGYEILGISQAYDFDHSKRLTDVWHTIGTGTNVKLSNNEYDFKDRLIEKNLGAELYETRYIQSTDYQYNLRNWLTHINRLGNGGHPIESCDPLPEQETEVICGDAEISFEDLLDIRHRIDDINIDCYDPCAALNGDSTLTGTPQEVEEQQNALQNLGLAMNSTTTGSITYPTNMYHTKFYNNVEHLVLEEELTLFNGGIETDECHQITGPTQEIDLFISGTTETKNLGEVLTIRKTDTPQFANPDCEEDPDEPTCGAFSDSFYAHSINSSTIFSYPNPPYTDLSQFPGASNSLVDDNILWQLSNYNFGEAEWDIHTSISTPQGTEVTAYKASVEINEEIIDEGYYYLGLHDGNSWVKVNGGFDYITGTDIGIVVLTPDVMPTAQQADNMVLAYHLDGNISIDAVWVDVDYDISCDCVVLPPDCQYSMDQELLFRAQIVYLEPEEVVYPTTLYRVMFCDGTEAYLLEDELATFYGTYIILQEIDIYSPNQTFQVDTLGLDRADVFAMRLYYAETFNDNGNILNGTPQQNGNIANMFWQTRGRDQQYYAFAYDELDRLKSAQYFDVVNGELSIDGKYGVGFNYDLRGNITSLNRKGLTSDCPSPQFGTIDNLTYTYNGKNQITQLVDAANITRGFKKQGPGGDYAYDNNGNMTSDPNKGIMINYNYLNLPKKITFGGGEEIEFLYDAAGTKWQKLARKDGNEVIKDYVGGIEYATEDDLTKLEAVYHEEGRATPVFDETSGDIALFSYEYTIRDHLGNSRISFSDLDGNGKLTIGGDESEIIQENHYYPFGMNMEGNWVPQIGFKNAYQYNGKELNEDFGLDWSDYGARWYDASIGRWGQIDPLSENYTPFSPYNYTVNNPIRFIDPDGRSVDTDFYNLRGKKVKHVNDGKNDKNIVLTKSKRSKKVEKTISAGNVIPVLSKGEISEIENVYKGTETDDSHEEGFIGGKDSSGKRITSNIANPKGKVGLDKVDFENAIKDQKSKGGSVEYSVHSHPEKDISNSIGTQIGGIPEPSGADKKSIATYGLKFGIVAGYNKGEQGGNGGGDKKILSFYGSKGNFGRILFDRYKKITKKIK